MVVDSSALLAIVFNEANGTDFREAILAADSVSMSAPSVVEVTMVAMSRKGGDGEIGVRSILDKGNVQILPFDSAHAALAIQAFRLYGKGRHRAGLNLGDGFAYALAKSLDEPLLFKGEDFRLTDVTPAL